MRFNIIDGETPRTGWAYLDLDHPMIAWLCYRGGIIPASCQIQMGIPPLSIWWSRKLRNLNSVSAENEFTLEHVRVTKFPQKPSRLTGFFHFETAAAAEKAGSFGISYARPENLAEIGFDPKANFSVHDAEWITHYGGQQIDLSWMEKYWSGIACPKSENGPVFEVLTESPGFIYGTEIRERAFKVVERNSPKSVFTLDLARIACEGGFLAGHIAPWMKAISPEKIQVCYIMKDFNEPSLISYFRDYTGPKRFLELPNEMVTLDLTEFYFELPTDFSRFSQNCSEVISRLN